VISSAILKPLTTGFLLLVVALAVLQNNSIKYLSSGIQSSFIMKVLRKLLGLCISVVVGLFAKTEAKGGKVSLVVSINTLIHHVRRKYSALLHSTISPSAFFCLPSAYPFADEGTEKFALAPFPQVSFPFVGDSKRTLRLL
jgi:hypothetical protein